MTELSAHGRARLREIRSADSLSALVDVMDASDVDEAYFDAKREWRLLRGRELGERDARGVDDARAGATSDGETAGADSDDDAAGTGGDGETAGADSDGDAASAGGDDDAAGADSDGDAAGMPGATVVVAGRRFHVHGVTHAGTDAERAFVREHVTEWLDAGRSVYAEQGIRGMYVADRDVWEMDDYRWAVRECERRGLDSRVDAGSVAALSDELDEVAAAFREAAFEIIDASGERFGREFERALAGVASTFLMGPADHATGADFASFQLRDRSARDPSVLWKLQRYYECAFLPPPLEREWLRRFDPELEVMTHARSERMAAYALAQAPVDAEIHLLVGAAHQHGVEYYLEAFNEQGRDFADFELVVE